MLTNFAAKWFALYYSLFGCILIVAGIGVIIKTDAIVKYLTAESWSDQPPALPRTVLKYYFLFTLPCLILSFLPFSWPELLFSLWSLIIVYVAGAQLVRWPQTRMAVKNNPRRVNRMIKITGAMMLAVSPVTLLLAYLVIRTLYTN